MERRAAINLAEVYTLIKGVAVVGRSEGTVQIGDRDRSLLLHHAPPHSVNILKQLNGTAPVTVVLDSHSADRRVWASLLTRLRDAQLLVPASEWSFPGILPGPLLEPERDSLVHRHGIQVARRVLQARRDAVVVVRGSGRVATAIAVALATSGVGHVHQQPDRPLRIADLQDIPGPVGGSGADTDGAGSGRTRARSYRTVVGTASAADASLLAANLRRVSPSVNVHRPAAHLDVALTVLAGDGPPAPSLAAELTDRGIPHLAARADLVAAVVGPFVLPGRSSCLLCALRQRTEMDRGRPDFEAGLRLELVVPPTQLVCAAAALAVADALDHVDGINVPSSVDGTIEWQVGTAAPRRRSWTVHPECGCAGGSSSSSTDRSSASKTKF